jgi:cytosine/adenosine deaminase-related metal-dependent hydrolase
MSEQGGVRPGVRVVGGLVATFTPDLGTIADGEVEIRGDTITYVGPRRALLPGEPWVEVLDAGGTLVMPGLVNGHVHSYGVFAKATVDTIPLDLFIPRVMALGEILEDEDLYLAAALTALEALRTGTTCVLDHLRYPYRRPLASFEAAVRGYLDAGIRATVAPMFGDRPFADTLPQVPHIAATGLPSGEPADADVYLQACAEAVSRWHGAAGRIQFFLGTDGPQRCTPHLLAGSRQFLDAYPVGMHSHVLEAATQRVRGFQLYGKSLVAVLDEVGLLTPRLSLVHFVWSDDDDHCRVAAAGASIVHCPAANLQVGSGLAPIPELLARGVPVALGTDGANVLDLSLFTQVRLAALIHRVAYPWYHRWIRAQDVVRMATAGGAAVHGLTGQIGVLRPGARADLVLLDARGHALAGADDVALALATRETGGSVRTVLVAGEVVVRDGRSTRLDEEALITRFLRRRAALRPLIARRQEEILGAYGPYIEAIYRAVMRDLGGDVRVARPTTAWARWDEDTREGKT